MEYTKEELLELAKQMRQTANAIYPMLMRCNVHPFIEFNGLMQKYVDVCERAAAKEIQFPFANEHSGQQIPVEPHDMLYLAEKLRCIFGPTLDANPEARRAFIQGLFGEHAREATDYAELAKGDTHSTARSDDPYRQPADEGEDLDDGRTEGDPVEFIGVKEHAELRAKLEQLTGAVRMGLDWIRDLNPKAPSSAVWEAMEQALQGVPPAPQNPVEHAELRAKLERLAGTMRMGMGWIQGLNPRPPSADVILSHLAAALTGDPPHCTKCLYCDLPLHQEDGRTWCTNAKCPGSVGNPRVQPPDSISSAMKACHCAGSNHEEDCPFAKAVRERVFGDRSELGVPPRPDVAKLLQLFDGSDGVGLDVAELCRWVQHVERQCEEARRVATKAYQDEQAVDRVTEAAMRLLRDAYGAIPLDREANEERWLIVNSELAQAVRGDRPSVPWSEVRAELSAVDALASVQNELDEARKTLAEAHRIWDGPETSDWFEGVRKEAAFQVAEWGKKHDDGKGPQDFYWTLGFLAGKALSSAIAGDIEKAKHHTISSAALLLNWHARLSGQADMFRPGIENPDA